MKKTRILTGLIGFPIVAAILILGNKYIIDALFSIVMIISLYEYFNAVGKKYKVVKALGYIIALYIPFIHVIPTEITLKMLTILIPSIIAILFIKVIASKMEVNFNDISIELFGILYIIGFTVFIPMLYASDNGKLFIWYIFLTAWGTDTFAYAIGMKFGKHKLTVVSPKKSIEGCIAGIVGAVVIAIIYTVAMNSIYNLEYSYVLIGIITVILSIAGQLGDFAASSIKRYVDIKDYSNLIPGHGGMLDRIDSLMFLAPYAYILLSLI